jgi:anti-sigma-K factor RskA
MNCGECQDLLVEHALGELDAAEAARIERHLESGCEACRRELDEIQESLGLVGASLDEVAPPPAIKQQLLARIAAERPREDVDRSDAPASIPFVAPGSGRSGWMRAFAYAATLLIGFLVGALATRSATRDATNSADRSAQLAELLDSARKNFGSPQVRFAALYPAENENAVVGHMMWDAVGRNLHFFAFDVEPPAANHELAVWFITKDGTPRYGGELEVSRNGECSAVFAAPEVKGPITQVVVTEELSGDVSTPQGPQRILSRFESP